MRAPKFGGDGWEERPGIPHPFYASKITVMQHANSNTICRRPHMPFYWAEAGFSPHTPAPGQAAGCNRCLGSRERANSSTVCVRSTHRCQDVFQGHQARAAHQASKGLQGGAPFSGLPQPCGYLPIPLGRRSGLLLVNSWRSSYFYGPSMEGRGSNQLA